MPGTIITVSPDPVTSSEWGANSTWEEADFVPIPLPLGSDSLGVLAGGVAPNGDFALFRITSEQEVIAALSPEAEDRLVEKLIQRLLQSERTE